MNIWQIKEWILPISCIVLSSFALCQESEGSFYVFSSQKQQGQWLNPMDISRWEYKGGKFECELENTFFPHGKFYFRTNVKNNISFVSSFVEQDKKYTKAKLYMQSNNWGEQTKQLIDIVDVTSISNVVFNRNVDFLLKALIHGNWVKVELEHNKNEKNISSTSKFISYLLPTIEFEKSYQSFTECSSNLPLMNYENARTLTLNYGIGKHELSKAQYKTLSNFYSYYHKDKEISQVLLDGYTDNTGSRLTNLTLAKSRVDMVKETLAALGIREDKMQVRFHGDRLPLVGNETEAQRQKNRRVTVRLVMQHEDIEIIKNI